MNGPPKDVEGYCNAWLLLGDDYGDNVATIRCQRPPNHASAHQSNFRRRSSNWLTPGSIEPRDTVADSGEDSGLPRADDQVVSITWTLDESAVCAVHGRMAPPCWRCEIEKHEETGS